VDLITTIEIQGARAAKKSTSSIPIVVLSCDPHEQLVASLARPGANVTGQSCLTSELTPKRLEILAEAVPRASRIAYLYNPNEPGPSLGLKLAQEAAPRLKIELRPVEMREASDFETVQARILKERVNGLFVYPDVIGTGPARNGGGGGVRVSGVHDPQSGRPARSDRRWVSRTAPSFWTARSTRTSPRPSWASSLNSKRDSTVDQEGRPLRVSDSVIVAAAIS